MVEQLSADSIQKTILIRMNLISQLNNLSYSKTLKFICSISMSSFLKLFKDILILLYKYRDANLAYYIYF